MTMSKCCIKWCNARKNRNHPQLTLLKLPSNEAMKKKWLDIIGMENINPSIKKLFVCSQHFEETCFDTTLDVIRLRDGAMPSSSLVSQLKKTNLLEIDEAVSNQNDKLKIPGSITLRVNIEDESFDASNVQKKIKVQLIDCNNDIDITDKSDAESTKQQDPTVNDIEETEININDPASNEGNNKPDTLIVKREDKNMFTRYETVNLNNGDVIFKEPEIDTIIQCEIIEESVYDELVKLSKMTLSVADQILLVEARNSWGRIKYKLHTETKQECQIQLAINHWISWVAFSKIRDTPLMYKCYICSKAWWRLGPFREHVKVHEHDNFSCYIENRSHECYMIACIGEKTPPREIPIESDCCWKCGNDYAFHKDSLELTKSTEYSYQCKYCNDKFYTCTTLNHHYCFCLPYKKVLIQNKTDYYSQLKFYSCHICKLILTYKDDVQKHYINFHSVPSDLPLLLPVKVCIYCNQYNVDSDFHSCSKIKTKQWCMSCNKQFPSMLTKNLHMSANNGSIKCRICKEELNSKCVEMNHIVTHSKKFLLVYKCAQCEDDLFLMNSCSRKHHSSLWQTKYGESKHFGEAVIVPRNCVKSDMTEEEKSITTDKKTYKIITKTTKTYESIVNKKSRNKKRKINMKIGTKSKRQGVSAEESTMDKIEIHSDDSRKEILNENDKIDINNIKQEKVSNEDGTINTAESTDEHGVTAKECVSKSVRIKAEKNIDDPQLFDEYNYAIYEKQEIDFECTKTNVNRPIKEEPARYEDILSKVFRSPLNFGTITATIIEEEPIDEGIIEDDIIVLTDDNSDTSVVRTEDVDAGANQIDIQPDCIEGQDDTAEQSIEYSYNGTTLSLDDSEPDELFVDLNREESFSDSDAEQTEWSPRPSTSKKKNRTTQKYNCRCLSGSRKMYMRHLFMCLSQYECTKCDQTYHSFYAYVWHFQTHGYAVNTCPQCDIIVTDKISCPSKALLTSHMKTHIKISYKKEIVLNRNMNKSKMNVEVKFVCVLCTMPVHFELLFVHWESHLDVHLIINEMQVMKEDVEDREVVVGSLDTNDVKNIKKILLSKQINLNNKQRICEVCNRKFNKNTDFKWHLIEHLLTDALSRQSLYSALKCQFCDQKLLRSDQYRIHMRDHTCLPVYKCELCLKSLSDSMNFSKHKKTHDIGTKLMQCDVCKEEFYSNVMLIKHMTIADCLRRHFQLHRPFLGTARNLKGSSSRVKRITFGGFLEGTSLSDSRNFSKHKKTHDIGTKLMQCDVCKEEFYSNVMLIKHMTMHQNKKTIVCACCNKNYYDPLAYRLHQRNVERQKKGKRYICQICRLKFSSPKEKLDHLWEVHKRRQHKMDCPICYKSYRKFRDVKAHIKTFHKKNVSFLRASVFRSIFGSPDCPKAKNT